jgi:hypothetical protein
MTVGGSLVCLGMPLLFQRAMPAGADSTAMGMLFGPTVLWLICYLFSIRGYSISGDSLFVHRLIWSTRIPLDGLESVDLDTNPFHWTVRLFGNPGIFAISGLFYNRKLGRFRAFVTNKSLSCVLRFSSGSIVVSPGDRRLFLKSLLESLDG